MTDLHYASFRGDTDGVKKLLNDYADINIVTKVIHKNEVNKQKLGFKCKVYDT